MRVLFVSLFIVIADQLSKYFIKGGTIPLINLHVTGMSYGESINVIGDFFKLTFVENPGIAFGIDVDGVSKLLLSLFTLLASIGVFYYLWKSKEQKLIIRLALAFILGGAIGNLIDRTFYGILRLCTLFFGKLLIFSIWILIYNFRKNMIVSQYLILQIFGNYWCNASLIFHRTPLKKLRKNKKMIPLIIIY